MNADGVMDNIPNAFEHSEMTLKEFGEGSGSDGPIGGPETIGSRLDKMGCPALPHGTAAITPLTPLA